MFDTPQFKPHLTPVIIPGEGVLLLSEEGARALHGRLYERIAPLIDGTRSADALVTTLGDEFDAAHVYYALMMLEKNGHLIEALPSPIPTEQAAFWSEMGLEPAAAQEALSNQTVALRTVGAVDAVPLRGALASLGVAVREESPTLTIVLADDYRRPALLELNAGLHAAGRPWLALKVNGLEPWIGPLYRPQQPGCHACLVKRLARHRQAEAFAARHQGHDEPMITACAASPTTQRLAAELAALEIAKHLTGAPPSLAGGLISLDSRTLATQRHRLLADPFCPICGKPPQPAARPIELAPRKVHFTQDGGHRHVAPEQTLRRYEPLVSPITGIVSQLRPVQEAELTQVYMAGHNHAFRLDKLDHLKFSLRHASAGKGVSATQAKTSALCEALERYSGERQGDEVVITASYRQMLDRHGRDVIHPNAVMGFSEKQLAEREAWNAKKSKFNRVTEPLDEALPIDWTPVWSLTHQRQRYLPTQLLYFQSLASGGGERFFAIGCSNGNASGNTLEEAILQGFFELVERDATALWWYNRLSRPGVDLASFGEPWLLDLADYYDTALGRDCWALDLTSDLGIPVFVAVSRQREDAQDRLLFGLGCHLEARIALQRAFAEMNQMLGMAQERPEAGDTAIEDEETRRWLTGATLENQPYMAPNPDLPARQRTEFPQRHAGDLLADIAICREIIESRGMEMLALDQTRADVGLPVAKVIVPGLRHFWARFGPGRLYEVPVAMGWLARPLSEDELNPIPIFF